MHVPLVDALSEADAAVWARCHHGLDRWHRVALVSDSTMLTTCERILTAPLDLRDAVPSGEFFCRSCVIGLAELT